MLCCDAYTKVLRIFNGYSLAFLSFLFTAQLHCHEHLNLLYTKPCKNFSLDSFPLSSFVLMLWRALTEASHLKLVAPEPSLPLKLQGWRARSHGGAQHSPGAFWGPDSHGLSSTA